MTLSAPASTRRRLAARLGAVAVAAALAATTLAGCSSGASSGTKNITFLSWDGQAVIKPLVAKYEKENPGYTVTVSYSTPVAPYIQKLQTQLGSNSGPDVFIITAENKQQIMSNKLARDLSDQSWTSNLGSAEKATYTKGGKLYGSAVSSWGGGFLVNQELLTKAGVTEFPTTWQGFLDLCKKLKASGTQPYLEAGDGLSITIAALLGLQNAKLDGKMDQDIWDGKTTFAKSWTPAIKTWYEMFSEGILPSSVAGLTGDQVTQQFEQGKVAMMSTGSWGLAPVRQAAPDLKLAFEPVPGTTGTPYWAGAVSPGLAVNAKSKNSAAALKFLKFMQSKEGVEMYQKETSSITTTKDFTPKLDAALDTMVPDVRKGDFYLPAVSWIDHNDALGVQVTALIQQTISGKITPSELAAGMDEKLKSVR